VISRTVTPREAPQVPFMSTEKIKEHLEFRKKMEELAEEGEYILWRVPEPYIEFEIIPGSGLKKRIPIDNLYMHKSCWLSAIYTGGVKSIYYTLDKLGIKYFDDHNQLTCTGWAYHGGAACPLETSLTVATRNWHEAWKSKNYLAIHCVTTHGMYYDEREVLVEDKGIRDKVKENLKKLGRELVIPEYIVHIHEVIYAMRDEIARLSPYSYDGCTAVEHNACHYWKLAPFEVIGGTNPVTLSGLVEALGGECKRYTEWFTCCGMGFGHIGWFNVGIGSMSPRKRYLNRACGIPKMCSAYEEVHPDFIILNDPGCGIVFDRSQWYSDVYLGKKTDIPVLWYSQVAALALGAHPKRDVGLDLHIISHDRLLRKMGIKWE